MNFHKQDPLQDVRKHAAEEKRIVEEYKNRKEQIPKARYSLFSPSNLLIVQQRERLLLSLLRNSGLSQLDQHKILDLGCGTGFWLREFIQWGAQPGSLYGVDLLEERIIEAKKKCPDETHLHSGTASSIQYPDQFFDIVLQATVMSSILQPSLREQIAGEMLRVVKKRGVIIWYDFFMNNPNNKQVRGITKQEIKKLFPGCRIILKRTTLAPPLGRWVAPYSDFLGILFESLPFLCTHYIGIISKT